MTDFENAYRLSRFMEEALGLYGTPEGKLPMDPLSNMYIQRHCILGFYDSASLCAQRTAEWVLPDIEAKIQRLENV